MLRQSQNEIGPPLRKRIAPWTGVRDDAHIDAGRLRPNAREKLRHEHQLDVIAGADGEAHARAGRVEGRGAGHDASDIAQGALERSEHRLRPRRDDHAFSRAHEQRIAQLGAQPREGMAGGRLREAEPFGCLRDMPLHEQGMEREHQVQVQATKIGCVEMHLMHGSYV
ncbi:hypothetical protein LZC95_40585 [Pendulispora brunnea]|uniref:Uncharacterized protein n=1 Tax=Pendulispora brunnea TaxID=2905690 RepID=A0ABZ2K1X3_9BACT